MRRNAESIGKKEWKGKENMFLNTVVDTLECDILREKMLGAERIVYDEQYSYIKASAKQRVDDNYNRVKISPKHLIGYDKTNSRKEIENAINYIAERIGVEKVDIEVSRIDIAVDSNEDYSKSKKFNLYFFELLTFNERHDKKFVCTSLNDYKDNNIYLNSRDLKVSIYDKEKESKGLHAYKTRTEFRWVRYASLDTKKMCTRVIERLKGIEDNNAELEAKMIFRLHKNYEEEKAKGEIKTFTEFVRKYDKFFYNRNIIKGVYASIGLKGNFNTWIKEFKNKQPNFEYYTLKDIKAYRNLMIKSIKAYIKS